MSSISQFARYVLIIHGFMNIAQGIYCILTPQSYTQTMGAMFTNSPDHAIQAIGLGALGVGWYEFIFALKGSRLLYLSTIPMRLAFAVITGMYWGWNGGVVVYEVAVAVVAALAAFA